MSITAALPPLLVLACLIPAAASALRGRVSGPPFWLPILLGLGSAGFWSVLTMAGEWRSGLTAAIWITIASTLAVFALLAKREPQLRALSLLLMPYLCLLAALSVLTGLVERQGAGLIAPSGWVVAHIALAVLTYAALTLAAVAGLAVVLQDRALRTRRPNELTRALPALAVSERAEIRLLAGAFWLLALGLATGMAVLHLETGHMLVLDHKTLLTLLSFALIGAVLVAHRMSGARGRLMARVVLLAYVLVTLGYLGVKVVTGLLL